jgi:hypothetical protein
MMRLARRIPVLHLPAMAPPGMARTAADAGDSDLQNLGALITFWSAPDGTELVGSLIFDRAKKNEEATCQ